jgi:hypothetical protein
LQNKRVALDIYEYFFSDDTCEHIAQQTNLYAHQKIQEKTLLNNMRKRSQDKDWVPTNKDEMKLLFGILFLQGIVQKPKLGYYFLKTDFWQLLVFMRLCQKRDFILLKFLHFTDNEAYRGHVSPKVYKVKPVFDHLIGKFSASYGPEDQLSIYESLLLWKGHLGWKVYIPKKRSHFGMESFKLCEAKTGYVWNVLWYIGNETELKSELHGIDISNYA